MKRLLLTLALLALPDLAQANLDFFITDVSVRGYEYHDIVDIVPSSGTIFLPNTSPYRVMRVVTTKTREEVYDYVSPGNSKRRAYYLDRTQMDAASLIYWDAYRALIDIPEATALGWITRKTGQ